ncbi:MAG: ABC transporter ATP-binding protein [Planctomycetes bacterium]|nr:ABC transporter ATP-binding protein [Planctomycetota bacterium]
MTRDPHANPALRLTGITREYGRGAHVVQALRGVDLSVGPGEFVAIRGPSGSGKSTLLQILGLLDRPTHGEYWLADRRVDQLSDRERTRWRNEAIGFVFQSFHLLGDRSARRNVELPLDYRRAKEPGLDPLEILRRVGLADRAEHRPGQLSGGEKQRVAIARALVKRPRLLLLDEPTGNLDTETGAAILELLAEIQREEGVATVLVTHDVSVADRADRTLHLRDGKWDS